MCPHTVGCNCFTLNNVYTVNCEAQSLHEIPDAIDASTKHLLLGSNPNLTHMGAQTFYRTGSTNLLSLDVSNCTITTIDPRAFYGLRFLKSLDLSRNQLATVPTESLQDTPFLKSLILSHNPLRILMPNSFIHCPRLQVLEIAACQITHIETGAFNGLHQLQTLRISANLLGAIRPDLFYQLSQLVFLDASSNPWECNCRMRAFKQWTTLEQSNNGQNNKAFALNFDFENKIKDEDGEMINSTHDKINPFNAVCCVRGPEHLANVTWENLRTDDFVCGPLLLTHLSSHINLDVKSKTKLPVTQNTAEPNSIVDDMVNSLDTLHEWHIVEKTPLKRKHMNETQKILKIDTNPESNRIDKETEDFCLRDGNTPISTLDIECYFLGDPLPRVVWIFQESSEYNPQYSVISEQSLHHYVSNSLVTLKDSANEVAFKKRSRRMNVHLTTTSQTTPLATYEITSLDNNHLIKPNDQLYLLASDYNRSLDLLPFMPPSSNHKFWWNSMSKNDSVSPLFALNTRLVMRCPKPGVYSCVPLQTIPIVKSDNTEAVNNVIGNDSQDRKYENVSVEKGEKIEVIPKYEYRERFDFRARKAFYIKQSPIPKALNNFSPYESKSAYPMAGKELKRQNSDFASDISNIFDNKDNPNFHGNYHYLLDKNTESRKQINSIDGPKNNYVRNSDNANDFDPKLATSAGPISTLYAILLIVGMGFLFIAVISGFCMFWRRRISQRANGVKNGDKKSSKRLANGGHMMNGKKSSLNGSANQGYSCYENGNLTLVDKQFEVKDENVSSNVQVTPPKNITCYNYPYNCYNDRDVSSTPSKKNFVIQNPFVPKSGFSGTLKSFFQPKPGHQRAGSNKKHKSKSMNGIYGNVKIIGKSTTQTQVLDNNNNNNTMHLPPNDTMPNSGKNTNKSPMAMSKSHPLTKINDNGIRSPIASYIDYYNNLNYINHNNHQGSLNQTLRDINNNNDEILENGNQITATIDATIETNKYALLNADRESGTPKHQHHYFLQQLQNNFESGVRAGWPQSSSSFNLSNATTVELFYNHDNNNNNLNFNDFDHSYQNYPEKLNHHHPICINELEHFNAPNTVMIKGGSNYQQLSDLDNNDKYLCNAPAALQECDEDNVFWSPNENIVENKTNQQPIRFSNISPTTHLHDRLRNQKSCNMSNNYITTRYIKNRDDENLLVSLSKNCVEPNNIQEETPYYPIYSYYSAQYNMGQIEPNGKLSTNGSIKNITGQEIVKVTPLIMYDKENNAQMIHFKQPFALPNVLLPDKTTIV